jgi:hypothetical protein
MRTCTDWLTKNWGVTRTCKVRGQENVYWLPQGDGHKNVYWLPQGEGHENVYWLPQGEGHENVYWLTDQKVRGHENVYWLPQGEGTERVLTASRWGDRKTCTDCFRVRGQENVYWLLREVYAKDYWPTAYRAWISSKNLKFKSSFFKADKIWIQYWTSSEFNLSFFLEVQTSSRQFFFVRAVCIVYLTHYIADKLFYSY